MNGRQRPNQKPHCHIGLIFVRAVGACMLLILGLPLVCPQARSQAEAPPTTAERRVLYQAQQAMTAEKYDEAQTVLLRFISQQNNTIHYLIPFTLGNALALDGRNDDALTYYRQATDRYDADAVLWLNMGNVSYKLGRFARAGECLHKAYTLMAEKKPTLLYQAAICCIHANELQQAANYLERICVPGIEEAQEDWFAALVDVYLKQEECQKAVTLLRRLLKEKGDQPRWSKLLAYIYTKAGDYKQAAAAFKLYLNLVDATREDVVRLGDLYRLAGIPLKAAWQYEQALQWSASPDDYERIVAAYLTAHRSDKAMETLTRALAEQPSARLWHVAGGVYYNREEYRKAYDAFHRCFQMAPNDGGAVLFMGYCALKMDKPNEAQKAFQSAARFPPYRKIAERALTGIGYLTHRDE